MRFLLDAEQRAFADSLNALLTAADTPSVVRDWSRGERRSGRALWSRIAEAGVFALTVPEEYEGLGPRPAELTVAFIELGRHAVPGPLVETTTAAALLAELPDPGPAKRFLPSLATGKTMATLTCTPPPAGHGKPTAPYALDADAATIRLTVTAPPGPTQPAERAGATEPAGSAAAWVTRTGGAAETVGVVAVGETIEPAGAAGTAGAARTAEPTGAGGTAGAAQTARGTRTATAAEAAETADAAQATEPAETATTPRKTRTAETATTPRGTGTTETAATAQAAGTLESAVAAELRLAPPPGRPLPSLDPGRRLFGVPSGGEVLAVGPQVGVAVGRAVLWARLATAAQALGVGLALLDRSVAYVRQRKQFGVPIGSFQAVKHQLADAKLGLEFARPLVHGAALTMDPADVAAAKVTACEAAYATARTALQLHGAIGYTAEYDLSLWLTKTRALRTAWGTPDECRAVVLSGGRRW